MSYQQQPTYSIPLKDAGTAYLWALATLLGFAGLQHFYLGKPWRGVLWLLTWGLLGVGTVVDLFTLKAQTRRVNSKLRAGY
jgi:TM2 domain-containing membrane protein YozV